jgi:hypothetical protein
MEIAEDSKYLLIDTELSESRLFRTTGNFSQITGRDIADLLYLTSLSTYLMYKDANQYEFARAYARRTVQYGPYGLFRSHATDLYMLAFMVHSRTRDQVKLLHNIESKRFLESLSFDNRRHWKFFQNIAANSANDVEASPFFFRLESQLKISNARYKQWRRLLMDWEKLKFSQRQYITTQITQEFRRIGKTSEMMTQMSTMVKYRSYSLSDKFAYKKPGFAKRVAGTTAGAVAGRYVGKKIAQKTGGNVDKYKKVGTGIGAIAGYWASGRKRQK